MPHHKLSEAHQQGQALMHHPDINAAARYATYLVLLNAGRLVIQGEPEAVLHAAQLNRGFDVCTDRPHAADGTPVFVF